MPRKLDVGALRHREAKRLYIPTAELEAIVPEEQKSPIRIAIERRNRDLDPQLVWRGKDEQDAAELFVTAPPLYVQEKIHPRALIDDLLRDSARRRREAEPELPDLFADFNGVPDLEAEAEFYAYEANWSNRMILGDSLQVMASLLKREGLRGKVQCIYMDPPYGIRFNSNCQWSTTTRNVEDGNPKHFTHEPEQVKAFRDTWRDGIHSYLSYLRDRLTLCRELLHESGSIFVQIGDENVHRVRALMDEVFGDANFISQITFRKGMTLASSHISNNCDFLIWYAKSRQEIKTRRIFQERDLDTDRSFVCSDPRASDPAIFRNEVVEQRIRDLAFSTQPFHAAGVNESCKFSFNFCGTTIGPPDKGWKTNKIGMYRAMRAGRLIKSGKSVRYKVYFRDFPVRAISNNWYDLGGEPSKIFIVQTSQKVVERCLLMTTDPGDLVLDPTCGSGTTAYVAEQWGRRWITIDTSRVALALARMRLMGARYPWYVLADSPEGLLEEARLSGKPPASRPTRGDVRQGFVYERVPHITLKSIANNAEIDVISEKWQPEVQGALDALNAALRGHPVPFRVTTGGREGRLIDFRAEGTETLPSGEPAPKGALLDWEVPREAPSDWPAAAKAALERYWKARIGRQKEIDDSIRRNAEIELLYDKPVVDKKRIRVSGPFTVESVSPHRTLMLDENDELVDPQAKVRAAIAADGRPQDFTTMILHDLSKAGVQQAHKEDRITFTSLEPWPGRLVCAEGRYMEGTVVRRAAIFIGPEFGTVQRADLVDAAREAAEAGFDLLIACAFAYEAHASELSRLGRMPILKARMNPELHMRGALATNAKGNLFVVFGEPDIAIEQVGEGLVRVRIRGVDVFKPQSGEIVSGGPDSIALWMIDTDYDGESFFVRHCYFLGASHDPYEALETSLKAEIDEEAWASLRSDVSRPFPKPRSGRIAVKVINHLGDEAIKVFKVG